MVCSDMMKLSISRCAECSKTRLVDRIKERWVCFACKQKISPRSKVAA
ncbi:MAG: hypothetical protein HYY37_05030 [Candidatus Aenigmarchaeota archaeon]|nr:hypothetical protein [Candidatus Aenigmarchaeota archaeon]